MLARWIENHIKVLAVLALLIVAPLLVWASQRIEGAITYEGPITVETDIIVLDDLSAVGDITGLGNEVLGNDAEADAITLTGVTTVTGATTITGATDITGTLAVSGATTFSSTISATELTGDLKGEAANTVVYKGNLPAAADHTGEFYRNTVGDSLWYADDDSWEQLVPAP